MGKGNIGCVKKFSNPFLLSLKKLFSISCRCSRETSQGILRVWAFSGNTAYTHSLYTSMGTCFAASQKQKAHRHLFHWLVQMDIYDAPSSTTSMQGAKIAIKNSFCPINKLRWRLERVQCNSTTPHVGTHIRPWKHGYNGAST